MQLPLEWLKDYIDTDLEPQSLADLLTKTGSEAEGIETLGSSVKNLIVGRIMKIEKHPDADRLIVCMVDVGDTDLVQIVTGAPNVKEGDLVPVALPGAVFANGLKIRASKLRGVESYGMLCSKEELGLEEKSAGIFVFPESEGIQPGDDVNSILKLGTPVISFGITPNRVDCLSIIGMAREVGIIEKKAIKTPDVKLNEVDKKAEDMVKVSIKARDLCPLYACRIIEGIKLEASPLWMQQRLIASGMRPINNVVDITNYVMLELGQPLHAFDANEISGGEIIVRTAEANESFKTLDGVERKLEEGMLLIADKEKPLALAGVMGGELSEITDKTVTVLLESANFERASIRRTSRKLGLRSEASSRFEKGLDPELVPLALDRAASLLERYASGKVYQGVVKDGDHIHRDVVVETTVSFINKRLGVDLDGDQIKTILQDVGLKIDLDGDRLLASVPSYRRDIEQDVDLLEEVARIYGFDNIPLTVPKGALASKGLTKIQTLERLLARELASQGYSEIIAYSFLSEKRLKDLPGEPVRIKNPLSEEQAVLRTSLLPSMLLAIETNFSRQKKDLQFFEIAKTYSKNKLDKLPEERLMLGMAMTGEVGASFDSEGKELDFYDLKGTIDYLGKRLKIEFEYKPAKRPRMHPGRTAEILLNGEVIGYLGQVDPQETIQPVYYLELALAPLSVLQNEITVYKALTRFPKVLRDIALVGPTDVPAENIRRAILEAGGEHLTSVELFDMYTGPQLGEGKRSLAYALSFQAPDRTLTDLEIDASLQNIKDKMSTFGFSIRS